MPFFPHRAHSPGTSEYTPVPQCLPGGFPPLRELRAISCTTASQGVFQTEGLSFQAYVVDLRHYTLWNAICVITVLKTH